MQLQSPDDTSYSLYLDDVRDPETDRDWVIVRNMDQFVEIVEERGLPKHMSLDHDLGEDEPDGMDVAWWLVNRAMEGAFDLSEVTVNVHSANLVGAENIRSLISNFKRHQY